MSDKSVTTNTTDGDDLKRQLVRRVAVAGVLIAMLLGALAFIDYLGQPSDTPESTGPTFTAPVPVAKKEVTQPVTPALPEPVRDEAPAVDAAEPATESPARPEVEAQPALPAAAPLPPARATATPSARSPRAAEMAPLPEGTSAASEHPVSPSPVSPTPALAASAPAVEPPAPPRLFSGYAVQAGVFADAQHAEELRARLTLNGIPSTLEARVQVGPFKTRAEAEAARQKMKALGIDGILLPPKGAKR